MAGMVFRRLTGNGTGQSLVDRLTSMKHSLAGSLIAKTICKATTDEMNAPKRKHLNILVNCTYETRLAMPEFANYIIGRSHNSSWVVSFKALITIHHLMNAGSERFSQYLASNNCQLSVPRSFEKSASQASSMFTFIRQYAKYLDARSASYRDVAFDFCKMKKKSEDVNIKTMPQSKLFKVLPPLERQIDALIAFDASSTELMNGVILAAYFLLYKDLIRLYAVYNEGMINIIEKFFSMSKRDCQEALRIYKAFLKRMEYVNQFVKVAEACDSLQLDGGFGRQSLIFKPVPSSVLEALEQHLADLDGRKNNDRTKSSPNSPAITSATSGTNATSSSSSNDLLGADFKRHNEQQQRIIEEERQRLEAFVTRARLKSSTQGRGGASAAQGSSSDEVDLLQLFSDDWPQQQSQQQLSTNTLFDDFFMQSGSSTSPSAPPATNHTLVLPPPHQTQQPHLLSQFLALQPTQPALNSTNPFISQTSHSSPPPALGNSPWNPSESAIVPVTSITSSASKDLDFRLAEIAGQLSLSNGGVDGGSTPVNWSRSTPGNQPSRPQQPTIGRTPVFPPMGSNNPTNPWGPGQVSEPNIAAMPMMTQGISTVTMQHQQQFPAFLNTPQQYHSNPYLYNGSALQPSQQLPQSANLFQTGVSGAVTSTAGASRPLNPLNPFL